MTRILFLGDIFGKAGRQMVRYHLSAIIGQREIDLALANGENAAGGLGLTRETSSELFDLGLAALSGGNHSFRYREMTDLMNKDHRLIRPANYPDPCPGRGWVMLTTPGGTRVAFGNVMGRTFISQTLACPFRSADLMLEDMKKAGAQVTIIDVHGEATSEKRALAWYLDGRLGALLGTHTHVQTSDAQILPKGLAYITDVGMTGPHQSVIGMGREEVIESFLTGRPQRFLPAKQGGQLEGVVLDFDGDGRAVAIEAVRVKRDGQLPALA